MEKLDYYDFLKKMPEIIIEDFSPIKIYDYIDNIKEFYECFEKKPIIKINKNILSNFILLCKNNNNNDVKFDFLKKNVSIEIENIPILIIRHTENSMIYECNNSNELNGKFFIIENQNNDFYYLDEEEKKTFKRNILLKLFRENK